MQPAGDSGGDQWEFSRKGKLGGSEVFIGGRGGITPQYFYNCETDGQKTAMLEEKGSRFIL